MGETGRLWTRLALSSWLATVAQLFVSVLLCEI